MRGWRAPHRGVDPSTLSWPPAIRPKSLPQYASRLSKVATTAAKVGAAKEQSGGVARVAAIDGDGWTGAGSAPVADCARLRAAPRRDGGGSTAPTRGGSVFAAGASLLVHAAIVAAAALSLGAPQPTGAPEAIAVELVASTGEASTPAPERQSTGAALAPHDDATAPAPTAADDAPPVPSPSPPTAPRETVELSTPAPTKAPDTVAAATPNADATAIPLPPEAAAAAETTDIAPPAPPPPPRSPAPSPDAERAVVTSIPRPPQPASAPPEADFAAPVAAPRVEPRASARPPRTTAQAAVRPKPTARLSNARAEASAAAPAPGRGAAEPAAYRSALLAKIWGAARYPEAERERGATGVATVRFALDAAGAVTLADLVRSSGDRALDDEAVAAVRRASPLPPPPLGAPRSYSAPIGFELR